MVTVTAVWDVRGEVIIETQRNEGRHTAWRRPSYTKSVETPEIQGGGVLQILVPLASFDPNTHIDQCVCVCVCYSRMQELLLIHSWKSTPDLSPRHICQRRIKASDMKKPEDTNKSAQSPRGTALYGGSVCARTHECASSSGALLMRGHEKVGHVRVPHSAACSLTTRNGKVRCTSVLLSLSHAHTDTLQEEEELSDGHHRGDQYAF